jgi:hypothetical protein
MWGWGRDDRSGRYRPRYSDRARCPLRERAAARRRDRGLRGRVAGQSAGSVWAVGTGSWEIPGPQRRSRQGVLSGESGPSGLGSGSGSRSGWDASTASQEDSIGHPSTVPRPLPFPRSSRCRSSSPPPPRRASRPREASEAWPNVTRRSSAGRTLIHLKPQRKRLTRTAGQTAGRLAAVAGGRAAGAGWGAAPAPPDPDHLLLTAGWAEHHAPSASRPFMTRRLFWPAESFGPLSTGQKAPGQTVRLVKSAPHLLRSDCHLRPRSEPTVPQIPARPGDSVRPVGPAAPEYGPATRFIGRDSDRPKRKLGEWTHPRHHSCRGHIPGIRPRRTRPRRIRPRRHPAQTDPPQTDPAQTASGPDGIRPRRSRCRGHIPGIIHPWRRGVESTPIVRGSGPNLSESYSARICPAHRNAALDEDGPRS